MHYLLWRGKVSGPFTRDKISLMLKAGQISSLYRVSADRKTWLPLDKIDFAPDFASPVPAPAAVASQDDLLRIEEEPLTKIRQKDNNSITAGFSRPSAFSCPMCGNTDIQIDQPHPSSIKCFSCESSIPLAGNSHAASPGQISDAFSGYEILKVLGVGGMGVVYQARQIRLKNREVAIKVLSDEISANNRIDNEVSALVSLSHPAIVTIFDLVSNKEKAAIVMELILGPTGSPISLRDIINSNGSFGSIEALIRVCRILSKALSYAHNQGVFHLDLKPENILIDHHGNLKIVDFGIACFDDSAMRAKGANPTISSDVYGTVGYSAPENRLKKTKPSQTQDVYSLGVIFYEMLIGELPQARLQLPSEINPRLPSVLDSLVETALNFHPERRFPSMDDFDYALSGAQKVVKAGTSKLKKADHSVNTKPSLVKINSPFPVSINNSKVKFTK